MSRLKNPFRSKIKYLKDDGSGRSKTLVRTGGTTTSTGIESRGRTQSQLKQYWDYYAGEGTIFASVNSIAWSTVMVGYTLTSDNPKSKELIQSMCDKVNLEGVLKDSAINILIFGDAFIEKIYLKKKELARLKVVDSSIMVINADEYGDLVDFQQIIGGRLIEPTIKPETMIHLRLFPIPGTQYGLSLLAPNMDTIDRKIASDDTIFNAIERHTPKYVITVGDEKDGQVPPSAAMDDIKEEFEDINSKNEFVVPWFIKIDTIDEKGVPNVSDYFDLFQTQLIVGLLTPEESLGLGKGSTEATSRVKAILYERQIRAFQNDISTQIERQLFNPYLDENGVNIEEAKNLVHITFNSVTEEDEALRAKWLGNLFRGMDEIPFTLNEIRGFFGFDPLEEMERQSLPSGGKDKEPEEKPKEDEESEEPT